MLSFRVSLTSNTNLLGWTTTTTATTTKTFFSVINKFTENTCILNISGNNDVINNNLAE